MKSTIEQAVELYRSGKSLKAVGTAFGVSASTVSNWLKAVREPRRTTGGSVPQGLAPMTDYERQRRYQLKKKFGITKEEYDRILDAQGGVCAVCGGPPTGRGDYHVDHDHVTKKVRGLLCHHCNTALGLIRERPDIAQALVAYLERNK